MPFTYVTLDFGAGFVTATGDNAGARAVLTPVAPMTNGPTVIDASITLPIAANGLTPKPIAATTDDGTTVTGGGTPAYRIQVEARGRNLANFIAEIPHDAGPVVDVAILTHLAAPPAFTAPLSAIRAAADYLNTTPPATGQAIVWNGTKYAPGTPAGVGVETINGEAPVAGNFVISAGDVGAQPVADVLTRLSTGVLDVDHPAGHTDFTTAPGGTPAALATGQPLTVFGNAPLTVSSGALVHTPLNGPNSAGYMQTQLSGRLRRIGMTVSWAPGANGAAVIVVPLAAWVNNGYSAAGVHLVVYGNGQWHCSFFNSGETKYLRYENEGRFGDCRDGAPRDIDVILDPDQSRIWIILPGGKVVSGTHETIGTHTSTYGVWELYESDGTTVTPATIRRVWADTAAGDGARGTSAAALARVGTAAADALVAAKRTITEYTTTTSNVVIPTGCIGALVTVIARGGPGGSGRRGAAGTIRCGGGSGGSGGIINDQWIPITQLGAAYNVILGTPGVPGAAVTTDDTNGNAATAAGATNFISGSTTLRAIAGGPGSGGTASSGAGGNGGAPTGANGVAASAAGAAGTAGTTVTTGGAAPGGAGGGITAANTASAGGAGGYSYVWGGTAGGAGGVVDGAAPGTGPAASARPGDGAGGGAASVNNPGQAGGDATGYGGGGGGGGASLNGAASGAGGAGGPDYVRVTLLFS